MPDWPPGKDNQESNVLIERPGDEQPSRHEDSGSCSTGACKDAPYAILFIVNTFVLIGLLGANYRKDYFTTSASPGSNTDDSSFWALGLSVVFGVVLALCWLLALRTCPETLVQLGMIYAIVMPAIMCGIMLYHGQMLAGVLCGVATLGGICWYFCMQSRIKLAATMLKIASRFISEYWSLIFVAIFKLALTIVYVVMWGASFFSTLSSLGAIQEDSTSSYEPGTMAKAGIAVMFYFFLSFFWGINVLSNLLHTTTAGAFADWWIKGDWQARGSRSLALASSNNKVLGSLSRAMTTSFGSICYGSLIIAVVQALKALVEQSQRESRDEDGVMCFLRCCAQCILSCIEGIMDFINTYAFVHVAIYGSDYCTAASQTWDLITVSGFDMLINQDLTGLAMGVSALGSAVLGGFGTYLAAESMNVDSTTSISLGVGGAMITLGCVGVMISLASSVVASVYVLYCEMPAEGHMNHPAEVDELVSAWQEAHGDLMWQQRGNGAYYINHQ